MKDIRWQVNKKIHEFIKKNGYIPTKVYLPYDKELEIGNLIADDIGGPVASEMFVNGVRKALMEKGTLVGLEIVWDANEFKVE
jgi:hypothetical protein